MYLLFNCNLQVLINLFNAAYFSGLACSFFGVLFFFREMLARQGIVVSISYYFKFMSFVYFASYLFPLSYNRHTSFRIKNALGFQFEYIGQLFLNFLPPPPPTPPRKGKHGQQALTCWL